MKKIIFTLLFLLVGMTLSFAQSFTVTGTITDNYGSALPGAIIQIKGTGEGTQSDMSGKYKIKVPSSSSYLVFSFTGTKTQEIKADKTIIDVRLVDKSVSYARNSAAPKLKGSSYITPYSEAREQSQGFKLGIGYFQSSFLNENFRKHIEDGTLKRRLGMVFRASYTYSPITFDFNWFSSGFVTDENYPLWQTYKNYKRIRHRGMDIGMNLILIPTSKYITPYAGGGYQLSELGTISPTASGYKEDDDDAVVTAGTEILDTNVHLSSPFWRVGILITPIELIQISAEYRASVSLPTSRQFNQFAITLSYNPFPK